MNELTETITSLQAHKQATQTVGNAIQADNPTFTSVTRASRDKVPGKFRNKSVNRTTSKSLARSKSRAKKAITKISSAREGEPLPVFLTPAVGKSAEDKLTLWSEVTLRTKIPRI